MGAKLILTVYGNGQSLLGLGSDIIEAGPGQRLAAVSRPHRDYRQHLFSAMRGHTSGEIVRRSHARLRADATNHRSRVGGTPSLFRDTEGREQQEPAGALSRQPAAQTQGQGGRQTGQGSRTETQGDCERSPHTLAGVRHGTGGVGRDCAATLRSRNRLCVRALQELGGARWREVCRRQGLAGSVAQLCGAGRVGVQGRR